MSKPTSIQDLLLSERAFARAMERLCFGRFESLAINRGELVLDPWPTAVQAIKFASPPNTAKPDQSTSELRPQVAEFFEYVREVDAGKICELQVRHGIPFSMEIEHLAEVTSHG